MEKRLLFTLGGGILVATFWGTWSLFSQIPDHGTLRITENIIYTLPIHRLWDILALPVSIITWLSVIGKLAGWAKRKGESDGEIADGFILSFFYSLTFVFGVGLPVGLAFGPAAGLIMGLAVGPGPGLAMSLVYGLLVDLPFMLFFILIFGLIDGLILSLTLGFTPIALAGTGILLIIHVDDWIDRWINNL